MCLTRQWGFGALDLASLEALLSVSARRAHPVRGKGQAHLESVPVRKRRSSFSLHMRTQATH